MDCYERCHSGSKMDRHIVGEALWRHGPGWQDRFGRDRQMRVDRATALPQRHS